MSTSLTSNLAITVSLLLAACGSSKKEPESPMPAYQAAAAQKFKGNIEYFFNEPRSHVLCVAQEKRSAAVPFPPLSFFIYALDAEKIIYEETLDNGQVDWLNKDQVQIRVIPGTITRGHEREDTIYIYDLNTRKKMNVAKQRDLKD